MVDYWAEWCGPCKMIAPILDEIADEYTDNLKVAKINIDENPQTPQKYAVRGIPTLMNIQGWRSHWNESGGGIEITIVCLY